MLELIEGVVVFSPERERETRAYGERPRVAFLAASEKRFGEQPSPIERAVRADAYASDRAMLAAAIAYARSEDRAARRAGPLRLVYVGSLGEERVTAKTPLGHTVIVRGRIMIGRADGCAICLRQGAHSDQNTTARWHAVVERTERGTLLVTDQRSTQGTWVRDLSIREPTEVAPGEEIAIACGHRLRIEGA
ncbi:MAG: FHA domain-containing protein [Labilithrix sp.]|nr:FHA domain-containing protein [Labilithrix sp.]MCW5811379.1 FHA domain-containing protein [Labilithrix sp.]